MSICVTFKLQIATFMLYCMSKGHGVKKRLRLEFQIQSTLVISKSKGPSKTLRDIRTSTYQNCSTEEKQFEQPTLQMAM